MDLAKPGDIKRHSDPNALSTFLEYLLDYGSEATTAISEELITRTVAGMDPVRAAHTEKMLAQVRRGQPRHTADGRAGDTPSQPALGAPA